MSEKAEKWSGSDTMKFVKEYSNYPCLWDPEDYNYKNKTVRVAVLQEIANKMNKEGFDMDAVRRKIRVIRGTYWNEVMNIKKADTYVPRLKWFDIAHSFLKNVTRFSKDMPVVEKRPRYQETQMESDQETSLLEDPDRPNKRKYTEINTDVETHIGLSRESEFELFGRSIARQLMELPLEHAVELQMEFQRMIGEKRLALIKGDSGSLSLSTPDYPVKIEYPSDSE